VDEQEGRSPEAAMINKKQAKPQRSAGPKLRGGIVLEPLGFLQIQVPSVYSDSDSDTIMVKKTFDQSPDSFFTRASPSAESER